MRRCVVIQGPLSDCLLQRYGLSNSTLQVVNGVALLTHVVDRYSNRAKNIYLQSRGESASEIEDQVKEFLDGSAVSVALFICSPLFFSHEFAMLFHVFVDTRAVDPSIQGRCFITAIDEEVAHVTELYSGKHSR